MDRTDDDRKDQLGELTPTSGPLHRDRLLGTASDTVRPGTERMSLVHLPTILLCCVVRHHPDRVSRAIENSARGSGTKARIATLSANSFDPAESPEYEARSRSPT